MSKRKRHIPINEGHHCLLEDFATTRAMYFAASELDDLVGEALAFHVKSWCEASGLDPDGNFNWDDEDDDVCLHMKSWKREDDDPGSDAFLYLAFGLFDTEKEQDDEFWISHFLGLAVEPFKVYYCFNGLLELLEEVDATEQKNLFQMVHDTFSGSQSAFHEVKKKKKELYYWTPLRLDATKFAEGLDPERQDLSLAFDDITKALEDFKARLPSLDIIVQKAKALATTTS